MSRQSGWEEDGLFLKDLKHFEWFQTVAYVSKTRGLIYIPLAIVTHLQLESNDCVEIALRKVEVNTPHQDEIRYDSDIEKYRLKDGKSDEVLKEV